MPTADALKLARDGTLAYGVKRQPWDGWIWPATVAVGRDGNGHIVAVEKMWSPASGSLIYGDYDAAVEWEITEQGRVIHEYRKGASE